MDDSDELSLLDLGRSQGGAADVRRCVLSLSLCVSVVVILRGAIGSAFGC